MYVIRECGIYDMSGSYRTEPHLIINFSKISNPHLRIVLCSTESDEAVILHSWPHNKEFYNKILDLKPYGFVDRMETGEKSPLNGDAFVCVDDLDLQMLSYVDTVECKRVYDDSPLKDFVDDLSVKSVPDGTTSLKEFASKLYGGFRAIDRHKTFFYYNGRIYSFFKSMCRRPHGWLGEEFYLLSDEVIDWEGYNPVTYRRIYRVSFTDYTAAKRLQTKVMFLSGGNGNVGRE